MANTEARWVLLRHKNAISNDYFIYECKSIKLAIYSVLEFVLKTDSCQHLLNSQF